MSEEQKTPTRGHGGSYVVGRTGKKEKQRVEHTKPHVEAEEEKQAEAPKEAPKPAALASASADKKPTNEKEG